MKFLLTVLFLSLATASYSNEYTGEERNYPIDKIEVTSLNKYQGSYVTLYLVIGRKLLGPEPTISKVIQVLGTQTIDNNSISFRNLEVIDDVENLVVPNYILAVVHTQPSHALNKYPLSNARNFEAPEYMKESDKVIKSNENSIEVARKSYSILSVPDISLGLSIDFSR